MGTRIIIFHRANSRSKIIIFLWRVLTFQQQSISNCKGPIRPVSYNGKMYSATFQAWNIEMSIVPRCSFSHINSNNSWFSNLYFFQLQLSYKLHLKFSHVLFSFSTFRAGILVRFYFLAPRSLAIGVINQQYLLLINGPGSKLPVAHC